jgi:hypothetical protein
MSLEVALRASLWSMAMAAALASLSACSSPSSTATAPDSGPSADAAVDGVVSCTTDPRVDTYTAGMVKKSTSGALTANLVSADPAPPALRTNAWTVKLTDASGAPVTGATLSVVPFMPDHGHGSSIVPEVMPGTDPGTYTVGSLYLFMPGVWRVTFGVVPDGGTPSADDEVQFFFCVEG